MIGPRFFVPDDCVEDDEELARRGDDRDELWLSGGDEFVAKRLELRLNLGDGVNQAADFFSDATSIPSRNVTPLTTFGN